MIDQKEGETNFAIKIHHDDMVSKKTASVNHVTRRRTHILHTYFERSNRRAMRSEFENTRTRRRVTLQEAVYRIDRHLHWKVLRLYVALFDRCVRIQRACCSLFFSVRGRTHTRAETGYHQTSQLFLQTNRRNAVFVGSGIARGLRYVGTVGRTRNQTRDNKR